MLISYLECKKNMGKEKESPKKETENEFFQEKRSNGSCTASYIFSLSEVKLSFLYFIKDLCFDKNWIIFPILLPFSQRNITFLILCFLFAILFSIFLTAQNGLKIFQLEVKLYMVKFSLLNRPENSSLLFKSCVEFQPRLADGKLDHVNAMQFLQEFLEETRISISVRMEQFETDFYSINVFLYHTKHL